MYFTCKEDRSFDVLEGGVLWAELRPSPPVHVLKS